VARPMVPVAPSMKTRATAYQSTRLRPTLSTVRLRL